MPSTRRFLLALALAPLLGACPSYTRMPAADQARLQSALTHTERQLAQSCYVAPFYRDGRYLLLSAVHPAQTDLLRDPKGARVLPGAPLGVLPAGTKVRIVGLSFPTASEVTRRSLYSPRIFTWVLVEAEGYERPLVAVIRDDFESSAPFEARLSTLFDQGEAAALLAEASPAHQAAVAQKSLVAGMPAPLARMAWGPPERARREVAGSRGVETWGYAGGAWIRLRDGLVEGWGDNPAAADDAPPAP